MLLYWLTLAVAGAVVLVLAGYLIAIAVELWRARRNVAALADELETVGARTGPLPERVEQVHDALRRVEKGFTSVEEQLTGAAALLER